ncbi:MAG TPA: DHHA2 domain-containing protein [Aggregatilineales bacterium]|nr:DHHA2 domain-containing protein [Aggregatilineales bacterium]
MSNPTILVVGHRNPDTDAIASAVGYAWVLNRRGDDSYTAARTGKVNSQTTFALERFGLEPPTYVADVWGRVRDLSEPLPSLRKGQTLLDACQLVANTRRPAPVLDENDCPVGLLSGADLFGNLANALSSASVLALARELERPIESALEGAGTMLHDEDHIRDVIAGALRSNQDDFLVVDATGRYVGLCRKTGLLTPPRRKIVMVDHNEPGQAVPGLEDAELVEVLDHHRLGNVPTTIPIQFHVDPVGSCSTLVAERGIELHSAIPDQIAGLLLCGILSDTLVFRSPTTTTRDQAVAKRLAVMAGLCKADADDPTVRAAIQALGQSLLAASAGLGSQPADEMIKTDLKFFEASGVSVAIAQVEVANLSELAPRLADIRESLTKLLEAKSLALAMLMVTDVVHGNSILVPVGLARVITALPYARLADETLDAPGVVSRKKQLLPAVLEAISQTT